MLSLKQAAKMRRIQQKRVDAAWDAWTLAIVDGEDITSARHAYSDASVEMARREVLLNEASAREVPKVTIKVHPSKGMSLFAPKWADASGAELLANLRYLLNH